jgi:hypothetical protein
MVSAINAHLRLKILATVSLFLAWHEALRMYDSNSGIAREIPSIEGKYMRNAVDVHRGDESRIMGSSFR